MQSTHNHLFLTYFDYMFFIFIPARACSWCFEMDRANSWFYQFHFNSRQYARMDIWKYFEKGNEWMNEWTYEPIGNFVICGYVFEARVHLCSVFVRFVLPTINMLIANLKWKKKTQTQNAVSRFSLCETFKNRTKRMKNRKVKLDTSNPNVLLYMRLVFSSDILLVFITFYARLGHTQTSPLS